MGYTKTCRLAFESGQFRIMNCCERHKVRFFIEKEITMIDYRQVEIIKARAAAFALLLQWAKEDESKKSHEDTALELADVCYTRGVPGVCQTPETTKPPTVVSAR